MDSVNEPDKGAAVSAPASCRRAYVVDLAWLRSTPWRERIAASFDPPQWREELGRLTSVTVRHQPASTVAGLLFLGWLASRLGWEPGSLVSGKGGLQGRAHSRRQDVELKLEPDEEMTVPGLAGVALETSSGMKLSLDRGTGRPAGAPLDPRRRGLRVDGAGRLTRRGRHPRRGHTPGTAARPGLPPRAGSGRQHARLR